MSRTGAIRRALEELHAEKLDASARGSGLNAVWKIRIGGRPAVLKTFSRRRGRVQSVLTNAGNLLSGRTPYTALARQRTERAGLLLWRQHGFDVPNLLPSLPETRLPMPHLCMEHIEGRTLAAVLADDKVPVAERERVFARFLATWGTRHSRADCLSEPRLLQEHGTLDHVLVAGDRLVTFDLEVAYRGRPRIRSRISEEICGYIRSLLKSQSAEMSQRLLAMVVRLYPHRAYLEGVYARLFQSPNPAAWLLHFLDRRLLRKRGEIHKYRAAEALMRALSDSR